MATVRQSITALYEESRKSAVDGAPMMAVIDTVPVADPGLDAAPDTPRQPAIVARFDELRRLAEVEARQENTGQENTGQDDQPLDNDLVDSFDTGLSAIDQADIEPVAPETQILPSTPLEMSQAAELALPEEPPAPDQGRAPTSKSAIFRNWSAGVGGRGGYRENRRTAAAGHHRPRGPSPGGE